MAFNNLISSLIVPVACIFVSMPAQASRKSVPIVNIEKQALPQVNGKMYTKDNVYKAIVKGGLRCGYPWVGELVTEGKVTMATVVRGKHRVWVEVEYNTTDFSIHYVKSENLNYEKRKDGQEYIHPFYYNWIRELAQNINVELLAAE